MTRRKASTGSPQPSKRTKVSEDGTRSTNGSVDSPTTVRGTATDTLQDDAIDEAKMKLPSSPVSPSPAPRTSRPHRAATQRALAATAVIVAEDDATAAVPSRDLIHEQLFTPITETELKAWQGWSDIESEPEFFNFILNGLGIQDATIFELMGVDESSISYLPWPLGLIFLYKFVEEDAEEEYEHCPEHLWFANQTTENACGTIAMLNIAMNCERLGLGEHLTRFKAATQPLHPALRGHLLSSDEAIRSTHNSFARRIDMLMSDLSLKLEWAGAGKKAKRKNANNKKKRKKAADEDEPAFHFIAYVPMGNDVWELNGMQEKPLKLGPFNGDWTASARERIATRMAKYASYDESAGFSLLALCHTPKKENAAGQANESNGVGELNNGTNGTSKWGPPTTNSNDEDDSGVRRAAARKGDYTPAVHFWLKKLADKGVLQRLATGEPDDQIIEEDEMV
ncbi:hypothetical protein HMPREF1624_00947 [Sporothrix schenckii ATCC 58251]|uniref:Ubiquitin carboxyl-terminal hydrolase n=1 Tax=Sporothrix schenckii (strain ATCC 58251 / de Perez 2211183) TaxID=1391915 RepID=U7Q7D5_SPOS1|nr:hypothetical protein HMPREF1624_00947 [Sporothrix schenckii ATCC 58251]